MSITIDRAAALTMRARLDAAPVQVAVGTLAIGRSPVADVSPFGDYVIGTPCFGMKGDVPGVRAGSPPV